MLATKDVDISDNEKKMMASHFANDRRVLQTLYNIDLNSKDANGETVLIKSVRSDDAVKAADLLGKGADTECADSFQQTPLHFARSGGMVRVLLDSGAAIESENDLRQTAIFTAVRMGRAEVVDSLLRSKANVNRSDVYGCAPIHYATSKEIVLALYKSGALVEKMNSLGETALFLAVVEDRADLVDELASCGADVDYVDKNRRSLLHYAASESVIRVLVRYGARVDAADLNSETPFFSAVYNNLRCGVLKELLNSGADVNCVDSQGRAAIFFARTKTVAWLLFTYGANLGHDLYMKMGGKLICSEGKRNSRETAKALLLFVTSYSLVSHPLLGHAQIFPLLLQLFNCTFRVASIDCAYRDLRKLPVRHPICVIAMREFQRYGDACFAELCHLRAQRVGGSGSMTFYEMLCHASRHKLYLLSNTSLYDQLSEYESTFPIFKEIVLMKLESGLIRKTFLKRLANVNFYSISKQEGQVKKVSLPEDCVDLIAMYLGTTDLIRVVVAFEWVVDKGM